LARSSRHREKKPSPARRVTTRIEEIGAGGDGVAMVDGVRVFTPLTAPGDVAEIEARGERGTLLGLVEASPHRVEAPCVHYGNCGGCSLQHVAPEFYRGWKRDRVAWALAREGLGDVEVGNLLETPAATRRRAEFAVRRLKDRAVIGLNARRSSQIVELGRCLILHPDLHRRLPGLKALAKGIDAPAFDLSATLCDNGLDVAINGAMPAPSGRLVAALGDAARFAGVVRLTVNAEILLQLAAPVVHFDGIAVTPPPGGFLQASREGEAALVDLVRQAAAGARKIADLFSGCGTFALPLARDATLLAVDSDRASIAALSKAASDAQRAGLKINPVKTEARDLFERPLTAKELKGFDTIVFDPPRAGAVAQAAEIAASEVATIIGVSCNPATFARDARMIVAGGYTLSRATPVDQFVYSPHVELVGVFRKAR
jgi:23S rRNA (uracil1939-C5)-methyltransferase